MTEKKTGNREKYNVPDAFSPRWLDTIKPPDIPTRLRERDGFCVRIWPSGIKVFEYIYVAPGSGIRKYMKLGEYNTERGKKLSPEKLALLPGVSLSEAHELHRGALKLVRAGIDPQESQKPSTDVVVPENNCITMKELLRLYKEDNSHLQKRTLSHTTSNFVNHIIAATGENRDITSIRRNEALNIIKAIAQDKPGAARNASAAASALFSYAVEWDLAETNPFYKCTKVVRSARPKKKDRYHNREEIKYLLRESKSRTDRWSHIIKIMIYTGQRPGEVCGIAWSEVLDDMINKMKVGRWWRIPQERAQKNEQDNYVYLVAPIRRLLRKIREQSHSKRPYVFPAGRGSKGPTIVNSLDTAVEKRLFGKPHGGLSPWEPHDLRRTFSTNIADIECPSWITDLIQDHKLAGQAVEDGRQISKISGNYNYNVYMNKRREWLIKWAWELRRISRDKTLAPVSSPDHTTQDV